MKSNEQLRQVTYLKFREFQLNLNPTYGIESNPSLKFIPTLTRSSLLRSKSVSRARTPADSKFLCDSKSRLDAFRNQSESKLNLEGIRPSSEIKSRVVESKSSLSRSQTQRSEQLMKSRIYSVPNFNIWPFNSDNISSEYSNKIIENEPGTERPKLMALNELLNNAEKNNNLINNTKTLPIITKTSPVKF